MIVWNIAEIVIFSFGLLIFLFLVVSTIRLMIENKNLKTNLSQEFIDRVILMDQIKKLVAQEDANALSQTESFLKFVSDSRDAAFAYIEEVQAAISAFHHKLTPMVEHYKKTGKLLERKPSEIVKEVVQAYDELMTSMPKDSNV